MSNFYISPAYSKYEINTYNLTQCYLTLQKTSCFKFLDSSHAIEKYHFS